MIFYFNLFIVKGEQEKQWVEG